MKVADMQPYRKVLEQLRNRLRGDVNTMTDAALGTTSDEPNGHSSTTPTHPADIGSDAFEQEFTLTLMENEEDTLQLVEEALARESDKKHLVSVSIATALLQRNASRHYHMPLDAFAVLKNLSKNRVFNLDFPSKRFVQHSTCSPSF